MQKKEKTSENAQVDAQQQQEEEKQSKNQQKAAFNYDQEKKQKEKSIEQEIMEKDLQKIEEVRLERVFQILCGNKKTTFNRDDVTRELFLLLEQSEPDKKLSVQKRKEMKHEIDLISENMIWEVDENLDKQVSKKEFNLMYKRCIFDKTGLEPKSLFYMVQFLMFDKQEKKRITIEDTLELLYVNVTNYKLDSELNKEVALLFGDNAVEITEDGEETDITWQEYLDRVMKEAIKFRRKKEQEKKKCKPKDSSDDDDSF